MSTLQQGTTLSNFCYTSTKDVKALLSAFKARLFDPRNRDSAIERCDVAIEEQPDKTECRLIIKMVCKYGKKSLAYGLYGFACPDMITRSYQDV